MLHMSAAQIVTMLSRGCPCTGYEGSKKGILRCGVVYRIPPGEAQAEALEADLSVGWPRCTTIVIDSNERRSSLKEKRSQRRRPLWFVAAYCRAQVVLAGYADKMDARILYKQQTSVEQ